MFTKKTKNITKEQQKNHFRKSDDYVLKLQLANICTSLDTLENNNWF